MESNVRFLYVKTVDYDVLQSRKTHNWSSTV